MGTSRRAAPGRCGPRPSRWRSWTAATASVAVVLVAGAGCGRQSGDSGEEASPGKQEATGGGPSTIAGATQTTGTDDRVFPGGRELSDYRGLESYEWRVNAVDNTDELTDALQAVDPGLGEAEFIDVVDTCEDLQAGTYDADDLAERTAERFGVEVEQSDALIAAAEQYACP